jgi:branched-chain amino acid aminotransferase
MNGTDKPGVQTVWLNGAFHPIDQARISPLDRGFTHGDGLFETMRCENGRPLYLRDHMERLHRSLEALSISMDPGLEWGSTLHELLRQNGLLEETSVIKIIVTRGESTGPGLPPPKIPTICLTAQKYHPPQHNIYERGWYLHTFRSGFTPPMACHKTLNYLYFFFARQGALDIGANEAVILDPWGKVAETSAGSLVARTRGKWWTPASSYRLPGITIRQIRRLLAEEGHEVEELTAAPSDLAAAETVWVLNSLIGVMPVSRIDDVLLAEPSGEEASRFRRKLFENGLRV